MVGGCDAVDLGASSKLTSEDLGVQNYVQTLQDKKVRIIACKQCAENFGIVENLECQNIEVLYTGGLLSNWLKSGKRRITI
jgi:hypothetical protein